MSEPDHGMREVNVTLYIAELQAQREKHANDAALAAARCRTLEAENERLHAEIAKLKGEGDAPSGS